ncbi:heparan-alpha-glucosaminide N-acetyltransferase domain-containing protein [Sphingosinicella sp. LHD-64]|uniref:DUF1624 domain-containing protein n=1 Tax=Sphingosinicella sp. LHD-64 TaxID=3072139 RepID=UPI00280E3758|nr:heparan-alpha-glucosaminide N-acetyltransferase domain-containing protein [Sphingosinicella sp. LHD-64]MDQ8755333.1 heparan-alpha-glucosaminide N-acetyltransferase domain-containing protein [Sphingosinicella sp. LHD-64]
MRVQPLAFLQPGAAGEPAGTQPRSAAAAAPRAVDHRLRAIDILRGLVIVLMVLDHVRHYFHASGFVFDPLDPARSNALLYATRWVTHFCAPTFVFLTGVSAWLQGANGKTTPTLSGFLLKRGLWLVVLDVTAVSFGWSFSLPYFLFLQVIWAIGWAMVAMAALVWLPRPVVLAVGIAIVAGHNLLDPLTPQQFGSLGWLWMFLHEGGMWSAGGAPVAFVGYPVLAWIGVMAIGYGSGPAFLSAKRDRILLLIGAAMIAAFLMLRAFNFYGDPRPWVEEASWTATIMRFLDVTKYPPSLLFVCATLGPMLLIMPLLERWSGTPGRVLQVFGAVPLFAYLLHIYLIHLLSIAAHALSGRSTNGLFDFLRKAILDPASLSALDLPISATFVAWGVTLVLLYPCCVWWRALKARRRDWWLSYL